jgi:hypothetical protein
MTQLELEAAKRARHTVTGSHAHRSRLSRSFFLDAFLARSPYLAMVKLGVSEAFSILGLPQASYLRSSALRRLG